MGWVHRGLSGRLILTATAEFVHEVRDFMALNTLLTRRSRARVVGPLFTASLFGLTVGAAASVTQWPGRALWPVPLAIVLGGGLGWVLARLFERPATAFASRVLAEIAIWVAKRDGLLVPQRLELTPEGLRATSSKGETLTRWAAIREIIQTEEHLFFFIGRKTAFMMPRRAFGTDTGFTLFAMQAAELQQQAGPAAAG